MSWRALIFFIFSINSFFTNAVSTITVSGASNANQETTTSTTGTTTTPGGLTNKVFINAGYAIPSACLEKTGTTPCNSCVGNRIEDTNVASTATVPAPCNENSIYENLVLTINVESDKTDINGAEVGVASESTYSGKALQGFTKTTVNGKSYSISATWTQVMAALGVTSFTCETATGCGGTKSFYFGPIKEDKFLDTITVTVNYSIINYSSKSTPYNGFTKALATMCPPKTYTPLVSDFSSTGLCFYEMFPGDEKAYITNIINGWKNSPIDPDTQLTYTNLIMYYTPQATGAAALTTLSGIQNNSPKAVIGIKSTEGDPLSSYKVPNLENSTVDTVKSYCFLPALQDQTGNIIYFLDIQKLISTESFKTEDMNKLCASPSEVVGVLSDKDCFIATVAFGTRNHPALDLLREFRNKYLHPSALGKKFIKYYYKNGPGWAQEMADHPWAKWAVKAGLMPVLAIVYLILNPLWLLFLAALMVLIVVSLKRGPFKDKGRV